MASSKGIDFTKLRTGSTPEIVEPVSAVTQARMANVPPDSKYRWLGTNPNADGTFDMQMEHLETGQRVTLSGCYPIDIRYPEGVEVGPGPISVSFTLGGKVTGNEG